MIWIQCRVLVKCWGQSVTRILLKSLTYTSQVSLLNLTKHFVLSLLFLFMELQKCLHCLKEWKISSLKTYWWLIGVGHIAKHAKQFTWFSPQDSVTQILLIFPCYRWESWQLAQLNNLDPVIQILNMRAQIQSLPLYNHKEFDLGHTWIV